MIDGFEDACLGFQTFGPFKKERALSRLELARAEDYFTTTCILTVLQIRAPVSTVEYMMLLWQDNMQL